MAFANPKIHIVLDPYGKAYCGCYPAPENQTYDPEEATCKVCLSILRNEDIRLKKDMQEEELLKKRIETNKRKHEEKIPFIHELAKKQEEELAVWRRIPHADKVRQIQIRKNMMVK